MKSIILYKFIFLSVFLFLTETGKAQSAWKSLGDVRFESRIKDKMKVEFPVFGNKARALDGKTITLRGYILPLEIGGQKEFIFSMLPYSSCFFCGGAGPETVIEVVSKERIAYTTKIVTLKGRLKLNESDYEHLMYMMSDASLVN